MGSAALRLVRESETMADERTGAVEGSNAERRASPSAWQDPRTWMTLCGLLLAFLGFIATQLAAINGGIQSLRESMAQKTEQIQTLQRDVEHMKAQKDTQDQINQQIRDRLAKVEAVREKP